jgi:hypothetical protein
MTDFEKQVDEAAKRVAEFDKIDGYKARDIGTIYSALCCGLLKPETGAAYDALIMLQDLARTESAGKN